MNWIFLSPHLDDVVLSCGGLIAELVTAGHTAAVWTICAGDPPAEPLSQLANELHQRWGFGTDAVERRREEDRLSCRHLGAAVMHFSIPDCIYRRNPLSGEPLIPTNADLFQTLPTIEFPLADQVRQQLESLLPHHAQLVCPMALGNHIDHHLTRRAAEGLHRPLLYYPDYPYSEDLHLDEGEVHSVELRKLPYPISVQSFTRWIEAIGLHASQISTFWGSTQEMEEAIRSYWRTGGGSVLWGQPKYQ